MKLMKIKSPRKLTTIYHTVLAINSYTTLSTNIPNDCLAFLAASCFNSDFFIRVN